MIIDIIMPKMGESIMEGTILEWRKGVGEFVEKDELFLEIGTDKVDSEIPSEEAGKIVEILANENDIVDVGSVIARIETSDNSKAETGNINGDDSSKSDEVTFKKDLINEPLADKIKNPPSNLTFDKKENDLGTDDFSSNFFTRAVLKTARDNNISASELEKIPGTGRKSRLTKKDLLEFAKVKTETAVFQGINKTEIPFTLADKSEEMPHLRKMISKHMRKSIETAAHVHVVNEVDMTVIANFVDNNLDLFFSQEGFKLTYTPFLISAVAKSLLDYPEINSSISDTIVTYHKNINIGIAVAVDDGLMVPVIRNCEEKNFLGFCRSINDIASRARNKSIAADELTGSTFSVSNFGVFNVTLGTPIINQPNVGILGIGAVKKRPVVIEAPNGDTIGIRSIMNMSLGFDHRLIDGAGGSKFLDSIRVNIESMNMESLF